MVTHVSGGSKVIGYFSHTAENVFCDGDACIVAGSEELMRGYLRSMSAGSKGELIKKTRFGEILRGLRLGGAYAFDKESYGRFLPLVHGNKMKGLPTKEPFAESAPAMHFIRIQIL